MKKTNKNSMIQKNKKDGRIWVNTKFKGVRYREHPQKKYKGKPDRFFEIRVRYKGKLFSRGLGWASEGMTLTKARKYLEEFKKRLEDENSLKKRSLNQEKITLEECYQYYIQWAKSNKKSWIDDKSRHCCPK